jgi:hypothetical protein
MAFSISDVYYYRTGNKVSKDPPDY